MHLTFLDRLRLAYRSLALWLGLAVAGVGVFLVESAGWQVIFFYLGPVAVTPGRIVTAYPTNFNVDDAAVRGFTFRYQVAGLEWAGNSFSPDSTLRPGTAAPVEYCQGRPVLAVLQGSDIGPFGATGLLAGILLIAGGLALVLYDARRIRQLLALVADATLTEATCQRLEPQKPHDPDDPITFVAHYAYRAGGQSLTHLFETSDTSRFGVKEPLVYQAAAPANAALLATLPGFVRRRLLAAA